MEVSLSSKRRTLSNSIGLGNGETGALNDSLNLARVNGRNLVGTSRHYEAKITQKLNQKTALEVANLLIQEGADINACLLNTSDAAYESLAVDLCLLLIIK